ncbi:hypothetical protein [Mucilaginibacter jinjuensis]|uniref:Porin n=1 Tax=Mucilaginibacter jinjuensis TaxID=1176721 RepID=A0ABY7TD62_9SPHI|nr:hypothetical protein [Mucilaginibacter jinjuensis]WCT14460.1 hypothetical protein PQO05_11000 [Mucilaginibacter jinjuensis]
MKLKLSFYIMGCCVFALSAPALAQIAANPPEDTLATRQKEEHRPGQGFSLYNGKYATLSFSPYVTERYLNQKALDDSYTDAFGNVHTIAKRNDIQLQKVTLYFKGWLANPNFRYFLYVWTANANMGQGAQLVLGGNLQYQINKHFDIGAGVGPLPTSRSLYGQWPAWLRQDARPMAEEFFRGSFTTGIWLQGEVTDGLYYKTMLGNNLSQLGVDASQLDNGVNTWSTALWWTSHDYGRLGPYGDFENHQKLAGILGGSFTTSNETRQSQPGANAPENSQIRLSDGTGIFAENVFAPNTQVLSALYQMASFNGGIKIKGFSLDGEYFLRWVSNFKTNGVIPVKNLFDSGFTTQASIMFVPKTLQLYGTGSYINGQYGKPSEITCGLNWYVLHSRVLRINPEVMFEHHSPVGYLSYPTVVGANGTVFMANVELFF